MRGRIPAPEERGWTQVRRRLLRPEDDSPHGCLATAGRSPVQQITHYGRPGGSARFVIVGTGQTGAGPPGCSQPIDDISASASSSAAALSPKPPNVRHVASEPAQICRELTVPLIVLVAWIGGIKTRSTWRCGERVTTQDKRRQRGIVLKDEAEAEHRATTAAIFEGAKAAADSLRSRGYPGIKPRTIG